MRPRVAVEVEEARQVIERKKIEAGRVGENLSLHSHWEVKMCVTVVDDHGSVQRGYLEFANTISRYFSCIC